MNGKPYNRPIKNDNQSQLCKQSLPVRLRSRKHSHLKNQGKQHLRVMKLSLHINIAVKCSIFEYL